MAAAKPKRDRTLSATLGFCDATRLAARSQSRDPVETRERKDYFVKRKPVFGIARFTLDMTWQRAYKDLVVRVLHMSPEAHEEIERKIGQSLARSRLTKLAT